MCIRDRLRARVGRCVIPGRRWRHSGVLREYERLVGAGKLRQDPLQQKALTQVAAVMETPDGSGAYPVSYTHLRAHETPEHLVCRLLLEKKKTNITKLIRLICDVY
eukprot:TRINITY_DN39502_c0_g1_i1.p1 TRINITY_DN39502_c0_g1~~TRINITY_DN39502_c0_g1_i1.p1  ORF type:complete len:106 (-),score=27.51 TRINITY_DN39502_c0_g1_i1:96-413(-)